MHYIKVLRRLWPYFYASKQYETQPFDPLLTPEEQQLLISSLEDGNLEAVKTFLYRLSNEGIYYEQDDLRIHLTSVLAQIRRFMLKYKLHEKRLSNKTTVSYFT